MDNRPLQKMRTFASMLGWHCLEIYSCSAWPEEFEKHIGLERIYLYQTSDDKFNLQINEDPLDQTVTHKATIKADRYGIIHIDWVPFTLYDCFEEQLKEARRIFPELARVHWKSKAWRENRKREPGIRLTRSKKKKRGFARRANS